jgi:hypothetical protein
MSKHERTSVAVLGTLAEFHREPLPYDLQSLLSLVAEINPDLLCLDITDEQWQLQDFTDLPPEYEEVLLPLAYQTDIVVAPIGGKQLPARPQAHGWRKKGIKWLRRRLAALQKNAPGPDAINQGWRHYVGELIYGMTRWLASSSVRQAYSQHTDELTQATMEVAHRNPGCRVLVVVNVQHCHHIRARLRKHSEIAMTTYHEL